MSKLLGAYSMSGNLDPELWFTVLFDEIPSKYVLSVEDDNKMLDSEEITFDKIKHLFKDTPIVRQYTEQIEGFPEDYDEFVDFPTIPTLNLQMTGEKAGTLMVVSGGRIITVTICKCTVYYKQNDNLDEIKKLINEIWNCFPKETPEEKSAKVGLIKFSNGEYYTTFSNIKKTSVNIEENYNDDFIPVCNDIIDFLNQRESGLILLYGTYGVGKTNFIRHLCSNIPKDYVIVPNSVAQRLGDPDFISYITSCKDYVFILEDCEQLLIDREENPWNNAISTILNMADGLLSDIVNIKFICTFNAAVEKIDPALLRKGRCFAKYEFKELAEDKVARLNDKYNLGIKDVKAMTLAEVYNAEKTDYSEDTKPKNKIGF